MLPCGGPERGSCRKIEHVKEQFSPDFPQLKKDDRLNWPTRFFSYSCQCHGNFGGYKCQDCAYGYVGEKCQTKRKTKRRNALSLTREEKLKFRDLLAKSRTVPSDFVVQANAFHIDPSVKYEFNETSVYEYFIWHHSYSARATLLHDDPGVLFL